MSTKIRARVVGDELELGAFDILTIQGHELDRDFREIEVEDAVLARLKGNRFVEVQIRREPKPAETKLVVQPAPGPSAA